MDLSLWDTECLIKEFSRLCKRIERYPLSDRKNLENILRELENRLSVTKPINVNSL